MLLAFLCYNAVEAGSSNINKMPSLYLTDHSNSNKLDVKQYEWCSDTGTNRFVTNDDNDFVKSTVKHTNTKVAVGGGSVVSRKTGTVVIRSLDHKHIIHCKDVLYIPECGKKLIPAFQFVRKGCKLTFKNDSVRLSNSSNEPMFEKKR